MAIILSNLLYSMLRIRSYFDFATAVIIVTSIVNSKLD